ncbi:hypothetical protein Trydic_g17849 [Trypoxylus dichotomus]
MNNRPYISEGTTIYNESLYNTVPAQFGNTNLLVNHGQHRKIFDSTTTSIAGQQPQLQANWGVPMNNPCCCPRPTQIIPQRQTIPDGVTYTFHPAAQNYALRNVTDANNCLNTNQHPCDASYHQPLTLQQQIALNQLQNHALEAMLLHEQFRQNPFKLQFHRDEQTNTDLPLCKYSDICMSKNCLLNSLHQNEPLFKAGAPENKPEQLFANCVKAKQLVIDPDKYLEDKGVQYGPMQESVEIQTTSARICHCKKGQYTTQDNQTTTKKVTFKEGNTSGNKHKSRRKTCIRRHRQVDEDSTDSTDDYTSDSSISSEEHGSP